ncbi:MAG: hypothetical protein ACYCW6_21640 [Candidatus Xenobia bacterium]
MLRAVAASLEQDVELALLRFMTLLEPMLMLFLGVIVGTIVVAAFAPLYTLMIQQLS